MFVVTLSALSDITSSTKVKAESLTASSPRKKGPHCEQVFYRILLGGPRKLSRPRFHHIEDFLLGTTSSVTANFKCLT